MLDFLQKTSDPVCKMSVNKNKTQFITDYKGEKYYFCSGSCKEQFDTNPRNFIAKKDTGGGCCGSGKSC